MYGLFVRYQQVIVNGLILGALAAGLFVTRSGVKELFLGIGFGAALVSFGKAWGDLKAGGNQGPKGNPAGR